MNLLFFQPLFLCGVCGIRTPLNPCKGLVLAITLQTPSNAQQQYRWLSASLRLDKMAATLNGRMANVVGYFVPLHSLTTLATHMYIFECCLRPTSGNILKSMQRYIKYLRNQNFQRTFFAGEVGFEPTTNRLTVYCANRCATPQCLRAQKDSNLQPSA